MCGMAFVLGFHLVPYLWKMGKFAVDDLKQDLNRYRMDDKNR
jgi:hypothetical protein